MDFKNTIPVVAAESMPISTEPHDNQTTTDLDEVIDIKSAANEHVEFIFGNGAAAQIAPTNGNDYKSHHHEAEDSGPETDVDALDEAGAQVSPIEDFISEFVHKNGDEMRSNVVVHQQIEQNFEDNEQLEELAESRKNGDHFNVNEDEFVAVSEKAQNPFFDEEKAIDDKFDSFHVTSQLINDNKFLDTVHEDAGLQANDEDELVESVRKTIDFSEKKEFSFEREEFEKEIDSLSDVQSAMQEAFGDAENVHQQYEASSVHSDVVLASPIPMDSSAEDEGIEVNAVSDDVVGVPFVGVGESLTVDDLQALSVEDEEANEPHLVKELHHVEHVEEHSSFIAPDTELGKF